MTAEFTEPTVPRMRPEVELLLCSARTCLDEARITRIKALLQEALDWAFLIQTAHRHGIMPLVYHSLRTTCPEAVPRTIWDQLRTRWHINAWHNNLRTGELLTLLALFKGHEIPAIPFKGPVLAASVYGNLALRQFSDLDILVHKRDILRAKALLISQGYRLWRPMTPAQEADRLRYYHEYNLVNHNNMVHIDLHWRFAEHAFTFPCDLEGMWGRLAPVSVAGTTVYSFSPEDTFLYLCMHGAKDCWARLAWICDIAEMLRVYHAMDWQWMVEQVKALGGARMLLLGLHLARDLLGTNLPEQIFRDVHSDTTAKSLAITVGQCLFQEEAVPRHYEAFEFLRRFLFHIKVQERLGDKARQCVLRLFIPTEKDRAWLLLPRGLSFLYGLIRPIRLLLCFARMDQRGRLHRNRSL